MWLSSQSPRLTSSLFGLLCILLVQSVALDGATDSSRFLVVIDVWPPNDRLSNEKMARGIEDNKRNFRLPEDDVAEFFSEDSPQSVIVSSVCVHGLISSFPLDILDDVIVALARLFPLPTAAEVAKF